MTTMTIPDEAWEETPGSNGSSLHYSITLNGVGMHLDAIEIDPKSDPQTPVDLSDAERFNEWSFAAGPDGPFETITIKGREYAVFASPFCS